MGFGFAVQGMGVLRLQVRPNAVVHVGLRGLRVHLQDDLVKVASSRTETESWGILCSIGFLLTRSPERGSLRKALYTVPK